MNIYRISQEVNEDYDSYDSAVVCAPDEETSVQYIEVLHNERPDQHLREFLDYLIREICVGRGVVLASFNAG